MASNIPSTPYLLLVDDSAVDLQLNKHSLRRAGFRGEIKAMSNGRNALEYIRKAISVGKVPALAILDLKMPGLGGFDILELIKQGGMKQFPVIFLSGSSMPDDVFRARQLGADGFFEKPLNLGASDQLFQTIINQHLSVMEYSA